MLMEGNGSLDFNTKKVDLAFTTDNPNGLMKLPFLKELWAGARNEMLRIHVRGTIQEPEVSAQSMGTFWTTVDEVFDKPRQTRAKRSAARSNVCSCRPDSRPAARPPWSRDNAWRFRSPQRVIIVANGPRLPPRLDGVRLVATE